MRGRSSHKACIESVWTFKPGDVVCVSARRTATLMVLATHAEAGVEVVWVWAGNPEEGYILMEDFDPSRARERFNHTQRLQEHVRFYPASVLEKVATH